MTLPATDSFRRPSFTDRFVAELQRGLATAAGPAPQSGRDYPAETTEDHKLDSFQRRHAAGLMRVNHSGEVCAQALYYGQLMAARSPGTRERLQHAAIEETDHLNWCHRRLQELGAAPSKANGLWYSGSFALGALAGLAGDRWSLGFVMETERQVEAHLMHHLHDLPSGDQRSRAIVSQMATDEAEHGEAAREGGGEDLPRPIPLLMRLTAEVMKKVAYRF